MASTVLKKVVKVTKISENRSAVKSVDDEDPALEVHDHVRHGKADHQLVAGGSELLKPECGF